MASAEIASLTVADARQVEPILRREKELLLWHERGRLVIESLDVVVYLLIAAVFVAGAAGMLGYSIYSFASNLVRGIPQQIVTLINDLLLVMIMMEILKTILSYLEHKDISLRPFLFIGIISATRRVLTVGAAVAIQENISRAALWTHLDDLLVNAGVILALAIAIRLVGSKGSEA
jgi:uncharacterized membrane protein (DUF373 family)